MGRIHWGSLILGAAIVIVFQMLTRRKATA